MSTLETNPVHVAMNGNYSLYRVRVSPNEINRFWEVLGNFRPEQNKIQRIDPGWIGSHGVSLTMVDIIVTPEELNFLSLSFAGLNPAWLRDWIYGTI